MSKSNQPNEDKDSRKQLLGELIQQLAQNQGEAGVPQDRRGADRVDLNRQLTVQSENGQEFTVVGKDLSGSGIRFISNRSLLGQKLTVLFPHDESAADRLAMTIRIIWSTAVAEGVYENGGAILEIVTDEDGH